MWSFPGLLGQSPCGALPKSCEVRREVFSEGRCQSCVRIAIFGVTENIGCRYYYSTLVGVSQHYYPGTSARAGTSR